MASARPTSDHGREIFATVNPPPFDRDLQDFDNQFANAYDGSGSSTSVSDDFEDVGTGGTVGNKNWANFFFTSTIKVSRVTLDIDGYTNGNIRLWKEASPADTHVESFATAISTTAMPTTRQTIIIDFDGIPANELIVQLHTTNSTPGTVITYDILAELAGAIGVIIV